MMVGAALVALVVASLAVTNTMFTAVVERGARSGSTASSARRAGRSSQL
jgi:hypothetical protein